MHKRQIDWTAIERDYRAGIKSNVQIANEHSVTETAIRKRAKKYEWVKDLKTSIRDLAAKLVREKEVREKLEPQAGDSIELEDAKVIEENANIQAEVIRSHRKDIGKARDIAQMLFEELQQAVINGDQLQHFAELRATFASNNDIENLDPQVSQKLLDFYTKIMELPSKAGVIDKLANTLDKLVKLERTVFGINDDSDKPKETLESYLEQLD